MATVVRSPSLRNGGSGGASNGRLMHDGSLVTLLDVVNHYNVITFNPNVNPNLDNKLKGPNGTGQNLNLTTTQNNLVAFCKPSQSCCLHRRTMVGSFQCQWQPERSATGIATYRNHRW